MRHIVEADGPSNGVEQVRCPGPDRIRAMLDQQLDDLEFASFGGEVKRKRVVTIVADVRVRAAREKLSNHRFEMHAEVQSGSQASVAGQRPALTDDAGLLVENRGDGSSISAVGCGEERGKPGFFSGCLGPCLQCLPVLEAAFARECVLNVTQGWGCWCSGIRAAQPIDRVGIAIAKRFQPAPGALSQVVEGTHGRLLPFDAWRPLRSGRKKVRGERFEPGGWERLPCRGQEAPQCALQEVCSKARRDVNAPGWPGSDVVLARDRSASTARRLNPIAWAGTAARGPIAWICELAAIEREAATADALAER